MTLTASSSIARVVESIVKPLSCVILVSRAASGGLRNGQTPCSEGVCRYEPACKPDFVEDDHPSATTVARRLLRPTRDHYRRATAVPAWPCSEWGLPSRPVTRLAGGLLPHRFTLACAVLERTTHRRSDFCGTFRRVAPPGDYPAPCPVESGLSSGGSRGRPANSPPYFSVRWEQV